jgi:adenylosuccinate synthase
MTNIAVLGSGFGDEGKGAITHSFSKDYDWIVRFSGGANAGHTIYRDSVKYVHNLLPSFDWRSSKPKAFLGSGMVIDLEQLYLEITKLYAINLNFPSRVYVDPDAFIVLPEHKEEDKNLNKHIGSTNRGIGPAYKSKIARCGVRIRDVMDGATQNRHLVEEMKKLGVHFNGVLELYNQMSNDSILFEGAQGIMLDINHGTYPYVSCGDATVAGIYAAGFSFAPPQKVYGVAKAYSTKVGEGPFPTEIYGDEANALRERGHEYGATTGRPRRVGWLDLPALKYACDKGGVTNLIITKFDILNGMKEVPVCTSYKKDPVCSADFFTTEPNYSKIIGWQDAANKEQLKPFINKIENYTERKVNFISCGIGPNDIMQW